MRKIFLFALLPLSIGGLDPATRAFDPRRDDPGRLAPLEKVEQNLVVIGDTLSGGSNEVPWSDRAWDHNRALLNERYTDRNFSRLGSWAERRNFAAKWSVERALALPEGEKKQSVLATLSPAEKYDLVMGTVQGGLADANRDFLDRLLPPGGRFPTWWGICDGSAAASLASPEPVRAITVRSRAYGIDVPFYAPDIKALVSMLWSTHNGRLKLPEIGMQCDDQGGGACADVNPASFHRALHHFLGRGGGHLLMDVDPTRVVWNHPIQRYETFFYPPHKNRRERTDSYRDALLHVSRATGDPRRRKRAPGTEWLLGVSTRVYYGDNVRNHPAEGSVKRNIKIMELQYELELDRNLNLIGGEWLSKRHPDLLWTIPRGVTPDTAGDLELGDSRWDGYEMGTDWAAAARASARNVMPLRKVVEEMVNRAR